MKISTKKRLGGVLLTLGVAYLGPAAGLAQWGTQADMTNYVPAGGLTNPYWIIGVVGILVGLGFLVAGWRQYKKMQEMQKMPLLHQLVHAGDPEALRTAYQAEHSNHGWDNPKKWALDRNASYDGHTAWSALVWKRDFGKPTKAENEKIGREMARQMALGGLIPVGYGVYWFNAGNCWQNGQERDLDYCEPRQGNSRRFFKSFRSGKSIRIGKADQDPSDDDFIAEDEGSESEVSNVQKTFLGGDKSGSRNF